ncbi:hypothetical protein [Nocardioides pacificus]
MRLGAARGLLAVAVLAVAVGATIVEPLAASAWAPGFGMLTDRFGVTWVLDVAAPYGG